MPERSGAILLAAVAVVAGLDQLSKAAIVAALGPQQPVSRHDLHAGWLALEYVENRGAAFGLLGGLAPVLVLTSVGIIGFLLAQLRHERDPKPWRVIALGALVGGAAGNLLDRVRLGYVVDFIAVGPWPNFNVADSAISVGVLILLWGWLRADAAADSAGPA